MGPPQGHLHPKEVTAVKKWVTNIIVALVVGFAIFYVITNPTAAADAVKTVFGWLAAIPAFFSRLAS